MWELIRANKRHSIVLVILMAVVLLGLGYLIGSVFTANMKNGHAMYGGLWGVAIAGTIWFILTVISFSSGDQILLAASKAKRVNHDVHPQLFNVVQEMALAAGLPMPKVYIIADPAPNAFATGRSPQTASVAITAGLLNKLNRDELQGVIGHEMSHILHRDILFVTVAGIMLGSIVLMSQVFLRGMFYSSMGSRRRYSGSSKDSGQAQIIIMIIAIVAAILAPIFAQLLYFALSRKREYLADAGAARLTRYPEGLASALEKIANDPSPQLASANNVTAPMYIANPLKNNNASKLSDLTSTHPPISERIKILRTMAGGASMKAYSDSFRQITKHNSPLPATAITDEIINTRKPYDQPDKPAKQQKQMHQLGDLMRTVNGFVFLTCTCGLTLKVPPNYKSPIVICPKCKKQLNLHAK